MAVQRLPCRASFPSEGALDEDGRVARFDRRRSARGGRACDAVLSRIGFFRSCAAEIYDAGDGLTVWGTGACRAQKKNQGTAMGKNARRGLCYRSFVGFAAIVAAAVAHADP